MWARVSKPAPIPWLGFVPIRDASDPFISRNGRLKPGKATTVLFGEGVANWKGIFEAAESVGGVEYYLIEQEGSRFSELDTAKKCLDTFRTMRPA